MLDAPLKPAHNNTIYCTAQEGVRHMTIKNKAAAQAPFKPQPIAVVKPAPSTAVNADIAKQAAAAVSQVAKALEPMATNASALISSSQKAVSQMAKQVSGSSQSLFNQHINKASTTMNQNINEMNAFYKENADAALQSLNAFKSCYEGLSKACFGFVQSCMDQNMQTLKAMMNCKNPQDLIALQNDSAKTNIDTMLAEGNKLSQLTFDAVNKAIQPIQNRLNTVMESALKKAA
jgi:phasin family protein